MGQKQSKNTCQPGLRPDASAAQLRFRQPATEKEGLKSIVEGNWR